MQPKKRKNAYPERDDLYKLVELDMVIILNGNRNAIKPRRTTFLLKDIETFRAMYKNGYGHNINFKFHEL